MTIDLLNFSPTGNYVNPDTQVSFDIVSDGNPIDISTLNVYYSDTVFTTPAIDSGSFDDGYDGTITATTIDGDPGYHVEISSNRIHKSNTVAIRIEVDTTPSTSVTTFTRSFSTATYLGVLASVGPNLGTDPQPTEGEFVGLTFSGKNNNILFQVNDKNEPVLTNRLPVPNSNTALRTTNVQFSLHDSGGEGINISTLEVFVDGDHIITGGAFISPFTGSISATVIDGFDGFAIFIDNPKTFLYGQLVEVRVVVEDLVADPSAVNTLDTTYSFNIEPFVDVEPPGVTPTQPPDGLDPDSCIEFDWLDAPQGPGPDFSTLRITLIRELTVDCITNVTTDVAVIDGVAQDPPPGTARYELFATPITVGLQIGLHIILCPVTPFNELETITVIVDGYDSNGNQSESDFSISTKESTPPRVLNFSPGDGDVGIGSESEVSFDIHDFSGVGVDTDRVSVHIDDGEAIINGVVQPGYSAVIESKTVIDEFTLQFDGYGYTVTRDVPFTPNKTIDVFVDAYDGYNNRTVESFSFTIEPDTVPPAIVIDPPNGTSNRSRDQIITVEVTDKLGVDQTATNITVQGNPAVINGVPVAPFDVFISDIVSVPGVVDGYKYVIDTELDFVFGETVVTQVSCADIFSNTSSKTSSFVTFVDTTPPTISDITPRDEQEEVSLRPEITFTIRDAYDVAFELTSVDIGPTPAIRNGLVQSGFSMNLTRISGGTLGVDPGDGYSVILTPDQDFKYDQNVTVYIEGYDRSNNNVATETATWTTVDPRSPLFQVIPADGDTGFDVDENICFEVFDDGYKVDISTLNMQLDEQDVIINNVIQEPDYIGTVTEIVDGYHYSVEIDPRFLLQGSTTHEILLDVEEPVSGSVGSHRVSFTTGPAPANPETVYIGTQDGVKSILASEVGTDVEPSSLIDGYHVLDIQAKVLREINRLLVGTRDSGAFIFPTNYPEPTLFYSTGDEITKVHISSENNGTIYLANRTRERIDVYYNILYDDVGRSVPDVYYAPPPAGSGDGYVVPGMLDGYFTDMVIDERSSTVDDNSPRIFLGTLLGAMRIDTDESSITNTEVNGVLYTYGVPGSGYDFDILDGTTNKVVALDVNSRLNYLYIATRSEDSSDINAVTYINLETNAFDGSVPEERLIHRLINDIDFKDE